MDQFSLFSPLLSWFIDNSCWVSGPFIIHRSLDRFHAYISIYNGQSWPDDHTYIDLGFFSSLRQAKSFCQAYSDSGSLQRLL